MGSVVKRDEVWAWFSSVCCLPVWVLVCFVEDEGVVLFSCDVLFLDVVAVCCSAASAA